ncbi:MAG: hypothetical protein R3F61_29010 [Myxococcota bacterium]
MADATQAALLRLYRGVGQRELMSDDPRGRAIVDRKLLTTVDSLARSLVPAPNGPLNTAPPRRIAVAMALAVFSQPHLASTFQDPDDPSPIVPEPLVASNEVLEQALGLSTWELDDLREEVDRRAGSMLKQTTLVHWLQSRYDNPARLFQMLFPGAAQVQDPQLFRRGAHLYAVVEQPAISTTALYLPWITGDQERVLAPLDSFRGRYVDSGLKRALCRGIGASEAEIVDLLERTVTLLPREGVDRMLTHDQWRRRGFATVTTVGQPYPKLSWLSREVDAADVRWQDWLRVDASPVALHEPVPSFDAIAQQRVHHVLEALYTDLLARLFANPGTERDPDEIELYDLGRHVHTVLEPMLRWVRAKGSVTWIARSTGTSPEHAATLLTEVGRRWQARADHWSAPDPDSFDHSVLAKWVSTLAVFDGVMRSLLEAPPDERWNHRSLLFLFAGHYIAECPMERSLMAHGMDPTIPGLAIGRWFWPTWQRLLDAMEQEATTTNAEFTIPDGLF